MHKIVRNRRFSFVLLACVLCTALCSAPSVKDSILRYFQMLVRTPQEKVYLQLDRSLYAAGENIWFKGYLVSAMSHREQDAFSKTIMVELVNRKDSVVLSKKVKEEKGCFYGNLKLEGSLPAGDYYLRSYTNWMKNENPDYFYSRLLRIGNSIDMEIVTKAKYESIGGGKIRAKIDFKLGRADFDRKVKLEYVVYSGDNTISKGKVTTDEKGHVSIDLPFNPTGKKQCIEIAFLDDKNDYKTTLYPYLEAKEYSVTFFPEGGDLLAVPNQIVAFKAQASNGYSLPVSGKVFNQSGQEVAPLSTMCDGMGAFNLTAVKGDRFYAEITSEDGLKKRFDLPEVKSGLKLSAKRTNAGIAFQVMKDEETPWPDTLYAVAHVRGMLRYMQIMNAERNSDLITDEYLRDGITHLLLIDKKGKTLSERLIFVKRSQQPVLELAADRPSYGKRERVQLSLTAKDYNNAPLAGDFGVSVTNMDMSPLDTLASTIQSELWLTSDLKGFVENPGRYFLASNRRAAAEQNLLMLTHGWRRFNTSDFTQMPDTAFKYYVEQGLSFTGRVMPVTGNPANMGVTAMASSIGKMYRTLTGKTGKFVIEGDNVPDSTQFVVRTLSRNNLPVTIMMDPVDVFPATSKIPYPDGMPTLNLTEEALNAARDRYFAEGGMQIHSLKELTITAKKDNFRAGGANQIYNALADRKYGEEFLGDRQNMSLWDIMMQMPGVTYTDDSNGSFFAFQSTPDKMPVLIINDVIYDAAADYNMLQDYMGYEIQQISILRHNAAGLATLGTQGSNGAFIITTRPVDPLVARNKTNTAFITPRGYNHSIEFYSPVYNTPAQKEKSESDLRITLYWNPKVVLEPDGTALIEYYTDDRGGDHQVVLEGLTTDGRPARTTSVVKITP